MFVVTFRSNGSTEYGVISQRCWYFESPNARDAIAMRAEFVSFLRGKASCDSDIAAAEMIYGELIGNVVRHAPGAIQVELDWTAKNRARLRVRNTGPAFSCTPALPRNVLSETGRGLFIVAALADDLHVQCEHDGSGCSVLAVLPVTAA